MKEETEAAVEMAKGVLQDLVVVVSLVRTLTDSFGSASDLYRKLKRKAHPKGDDSEHVQQSYRPLRRRRDSSSDRERRHHRSVRWRLDPRKDDYSDSEEELICTSSSQVRAEYDYGYRKLGEPFARGDFMAQTQLQSQIIQLQQTLLSIYQDLLLSAYLAPSSSHSHLVRLIQTTRTARAVSIQALNMQYKRMLLPAPPQIPQEMPGTFPSPSSGHHQHHHLVDRRKPRPKRRSRSKSSSSESSSDAGMKRPNSKPILKPLPSGSNIFCIYANDLQGDAQLPLADNYKASGDGMCPYCRSHIATRPGKAWEIIADSHEKFDEHTKKLSRTFRVDNRFVIKSHRENGGLACILCVRFRKSDTVCREIGALMEHLWRDHTSEELEQDNDIHGC